MGLETGPQPTPIVAVAMPDLQRARWPCGTACCEAGVYLNLALPPATPDSRPLLRSSVSAVHTPEQIDAVLSAFAAVGGALGLVHTPQRVSA